VLAHDIPLVEFQQHPTLLPYDCRRHCRLRLDSHCEVEAILNLPHGLGVDPEGVTLSFTDERRPRREDEVAHDLLKHEKSIGITVCIASRNGGDTRCQRFLCDDSCSQAWRGNACD